MSAPPKERDLTRMGDVFSQDSVLAKMNASAPGSLGVASQFWKAALGNPHLSPRITELVLLAMHASPTSINSEAIRRHVARAKTAGATDQDILDVLLSIVGVGNHAMYFAVPILMEELKTSGRHDDVTLPEMHPDMVAIRDEFLKTRGFWNTDRDLIARLLPDYFKALSKVSMEPWLSGSLTPKEREFMYIAIDCSVTHTYGPGLTIHIRRALDNGATREEILTVFQLASLMGLEGYILGVEALLGGAEAASAV